MTAPFPSARARTDSSDLLSHVMVVGGTLREWAELGDERWAQRVLDLGAMVAAAGGAWLTLRPFELGDDPADLSTWTRVIDTCEVIVDPCGDGRQRFAEAMCRLDAADEVNEATVASVLYEPADGEPDLVVVLGPPTQLPPSLVWELAYAELVFLPVSWDQLGADHVRTAIDDFAGRRRRFGGLDE